MTDPSLSGRAKRLPARLPSTSRMSWGARKSRRIGPRHQDGELRRERRCDDNRYLKFSRDGYLDIVLGKIAAGTARASWWRTRFADHQLSAFGCARHNFCLLQTSQRDRHFWRLANVLLRRRQGRDNIKPRRAIIARDGFVELVASYTPGRRLADIAGGTEWPRSGPVTPRRA